MYEPCCWECGQSLHVLPSQQAGKGGPQPASLTKAQIPLRCRRAAAHSIQVESRVDREPCRLTVDTGVASTDIPPLAAQRLCGVTGHYSELRGSVETGIRIGYVEEELPVYVAGIEDPCLLGLDFLLQTRARLDFGKMTMEVWGTEVPLREVNANTQVVAAEPTHVPPKSEARVRCGLS